MQKITRALQFVAIMLTTFTAGHRTIFSAEAPPKVVSATPLASLQWHPSGKQITYVRQSNQGGAQREVMMGYDLESLSEKVLYDPFTAVKDSSARLPLAGAKWSPKGDALLVKHDRDVWIVPIADAQPKRLTHDEFDEESLSFSPDGTRIAFVKKNNLYAVDVANGTVTQLTFDGSENILNGKLDWVYGEEFEDANPSGRAYAWSPDSKRIAFLRLDQSPVPEHPIVEFLQTHPTVTKQRYPKAGDPNSDASVCVANADGQAASVQRMPPLAGAAYIMPELAWNRDSSAVSVMGLSRSQNELSYFFWKPGSDPVAWLHDTDAAWINVYGNIHFLKVGAVYLSEKDGWLHAYCWDGLEHRQKTRGEWQIVPNKTFHAQPIEIDPAEEYMYFTATEHDPRERHIYRARIANGDEGVMQRLTKEDGTHFQKLSPDGKHMLESFSSVDQPPMMRVLNADGSVLVTLYKSEARGRKSSAEFHEVIASDGTKLYGKLMKPANFDPAKKYPVVVDVYGGPTIQLIRNAWGADDWLDRRLVQEGFVIWSMDGRGSFGRGHAFETAIFKNMGAKELADQLAGVEYVKKFPFVDPARFGIHGWSYGGYMTLYTLTHAPDAFKCGEAGAPVTDWKFYDSIYTERYMRTPKDNPEGYITSSPLAAAGNLKAKLLLIHGTSDDNVHVQNSMNFLDALTKAGRPYELQIQPGQKHGFHGEKAQIFLTDRMVEFFKRNL